VSFVPSVREVRYEVVGVALAGTGSAGGESVEECAGLGGRGSEPRTAGRAVLAATMVGARVGVVRGGPPNLVHGVDDRSPLWGSRRRGRMEALVGVRTPSCLRDSSILGDRRIF